MKLWNGSIGSYLLCLVMCIKGNERAFSRWVDVTSGKTVWKFIVKFHACEKTKNDVISFLRCESGLFHNLKGYLRKMLWFFPLYGKKEEKDGKNSWLKQKSVWRNEWRNKHFFMACLKEKRTKESTTTVTTTDTTTTTDIISWMCFLCF